MKKKIIISILCFVICAGVGFGIFNKVDGKSEIQSANLAPETVNTETLASQNINDVMAEQILWTSEVSPNWSVNPTDISALVNDEDATVVKGSVLSAEKAKFLANGSAVPVTPYVINVDEIYNGDINDKQITVCISGGTVLVKDVIAGIPEQSAQKMGLNDLSEEDKNTKYISYSMTDGGASLEVGKDYVFILNKELDGVYLASCGGYSVFESSSEAKIEKDDLTSYKNVITGNVFDAKITK